MPDDPKTPIDWQKYSWLATPASIVLGFAILLVGPRYLPSVDPMPGPLPPVVVEPTKFDYDRSFVLKDGKVLPKADAKPIIDAVNNGNAVYTVRGFIEGKSEETRTVTISGGVNPVPPVVAPDKPKPDVTPVDPNTKVSTVTYFYEKDDTAIPSHVTTALNKINRDSGFKTVASVFEDRGSPPPEIKAAYDAAKSAGLPALVAYNGNTVIKTIKAPKTEAEILEVAK